MISKTIDIINKAKRPKKANGINLVKLTRLKYPKNPITKNTPAGASMYKTILLNIFLLPPANATIDVKNIPS